MIKVENIEVWGFEHAIRGMRNPLNSWDRSDSYHAVDCGKCGRIEREGICYPKEHDCTPYYCYEIGENDLTLMRKLFAAGHAHRKYLRQIFVAMDITAPLYWWKEFDTYKVGTTANSCSTMHKIAAKEFELSDFSTEHLVGLSIAALQGVLDVMNLERKHFLVTHDKDCWWQMIQLLPSSYNQRRTVTMTYENVMNMLDYREGHKLDEWREFCKILRALPPCGGNQKWQVTKSTRSHCPSVPITPSRTMCSATTCSWTISYRKLCSPKTISLLCLTPRKSRKQSSSAISSGIRRSWQR